MGGGQTVCVFYCFLYFHACGVIKIGNILVVHNAKKPFSTQKIRYEKLNLFK
jgi:hypothetical protein